MGAAAGARPIAGASSFGGTVAVAGSSSSFGGTVMVVGGANSLGGTFTVGGSVGVAGTTSMGGGPAICRPRQMQCDAAGRFVQVCAPDGRSLRTQRDCGAQGQRCEAGVCRSLVCQPNQRACNGSVATLCNADGSGYLPMGVDCGTQPDRQCVQGACLCPPNLADCDGQVKTGCEADLSSDPNNCAGCGISCSLGESCVAGKCSSPGTLTFTGIAQDVALESLTGWSECYAEPYGQSATSIGDIKAACTGSLLMMACRAVGKNTLQLAAYAPREDVLFDTGLGNEPHNSNGVGWYFNGSQSWGFAPLGDGITRNSCDTQDSSINANGVDGALRLCWHTDGDKLQGGWRCGYNDVLNSSTAYERVLFQAP